MIKNRYPRVTIDLKKFDHNVKNIMSVLRDKDVKITAITKSYCAEPKIVEVLERNNVHYLGDSRLDNFERIKHIEIPKILVRIPMISTADRVVRLCDISLNSEIDTIRAINVEAAKLGKIHGIILMLELGDLREGILPEDVFSVVKEVIALQNVRLVGFGVNFTCYGGVIPDDQNLGKLVQIVRSVEKEFNTKIPIISGGNSSSFYLLEKGEFPVGINNLRIGEAMILGRESSFGNRINNTYDDVFVLEAEIVELKRKASVPSGLIGLNAFGEKPYFEERGDITRAILAIGRQDIDSDGIMPFDDCVKILGASSDHLIIDLSTCTENYKVGDILKFKLTYSALLKIMTSKYVHKVYL